MARYAYRLRRPEITRRLAPARVVAPKPKHAAPKPQYDAMLKADLVAAAERRGLDSSGTKADLIARLSA